MSERGDSIGNAAVRWGIVLGVAVATWTMVVHLLGFYTTRVRYAEIVDRTATLLPIACVGAAVLTFDSDSPQRSLKLGRVLVIGAGVGIVSALITVPFLWFYHHAVNPRWLEFLLDNERRRAAELGLSEAAVSERLAALRRGATDRAQIVGGLLGSTVLSTLLATGWLAVALIRRRFTGASGPP